MQYVVQLLRNDLNFYNNIIVKFIEYIILLAIILNTIYALYYNIYIYITALHYTLYIIHIIILYN
jgi:hypothetical protein